MLRASKGQILSLPIKRGYSSVKTRAGNMIKKGLTEEQENTFYPLLHHLHPALERKDNRRA